MVIDVGLRPSTSTAAIAGKATHQVKAERQSMIAPRFQRHTSTASAMTPSATSSHSVAGVRPPCSAAIESAPKATNSPCGMKITRVTENTSTSASAISP
ncbi:hypothetical protein D3C72_1982190 [compost metagenome]